MLACLIASFASTTPETFMRQESRAA